MTEMGGVGVVVGEGAVVGEGVETGGIDIAGANIDSDANWISVGEDGNSASIMDSSSPIENSGLDQGIGVSGSLNDLINQGIDISSLDIQSLEHISVDQLLGLLDESGLAKYFSEYLLVGISEEAPPEKRKSELGQDDEFDFMKQQNIEEQQRVQQRVQQEYETKEYEEYWRNQEKSAVQEKGKDGLVFRNIAEKREYERADTGLKRTMTEMGIGMADMDSALAWSEGDAKFYEAAREQSRRVDVLYRQIVKESLEALAQMWPGNMLKTITRKW